MHLHFTASNVEAAQKAFNELTQRYGQTPSPADAEVIVSLGGDGQTLHSLQDGIRFKKPVFGLNFGHVGFLQNLHKPEDDLIARIKTAETITLSPLHVRAQLLDGGIRSAFAVNEMHVCNYNRAEGIYLRVSIEGQVRVSRLGADGLIISTTIGSTAYNKSARGPILPLGDDMLAFTPNNAYVPDRMRACVIRPHPIHIEALDAEHRRADVYADSSLIGQAVKEVTVRLATDNSYQLLFDPGYSLHEKVMRSQFPSTPEFV